MLLLFLDQVADDSDAQAPVLVEVTHASLHCRRASLTRLLLGICVIASTLQSLIAQLVESPQVLRTATYECVTVISSQHLVTLHDLRAGGRGLAAAQEKAALSLSLPLTE